MAQVIYFYVKGWICTHAAPNPLLDVLSGNQPKLWLSLMAHGLTSLMNLGLYYLVACSSGV